MEPVLSESLQTGAGRGAGNKHKGSQFNCTALPASVVCLATNFSKFLSLLHQVFVTLNSPSGMPILCVRYIFYNCLHSWMFQIKKKKVAVWEVSTDVSSSASLLFSAVLSVLMSSSKAFLIPVLFFFFLAFPFVSSSLCYIPICFCTWSTFSINKLITVKFTE